MRSPAQVEKELEAAELRHAGLPYRPFDAQQHARNVGLANTVFARFVEETMAARAGASAEPAKKAQTA